MSRGRGRHAGRRGPARTAGAPRGRGSGRDVAAQGGPAGGSVRYDRRRCARTRVSHRAAVRPRGGAPRGNLHLDQRALAPRLRHAARSRGLQPSGRLAGAAAGRGGDRPGCRGARPRRGHLGAGRNAGRVPGREPASAPPLLHGRGRPCARRRGAPGGGPGRRRGRDPRCRRAALARGGVGRRAGSRGLSRERRRVRGRSLPRVRPGAPAQRAGAAG